jgi:hypothetical protein
VEKVGGILEHQGFRSDGGSRPVSSRLTILLLSVEKLVFDLSVLVLRGELISIDCLLSLVTFLVRIGVFDLRHRHLALSRWLILRHSHSVLLISLTVLLAMLLSQLGRLLLPLLLLLLSFLSRLLVFLFLFLLEFLLLLPLLLFFSLTGLLFFVLLLF